MKIETIREAALEFANFLIAKSCIEKMRTLPIYMLERGNIEDFDYMTAIILYNIEKEKIEIYDEEDPDYSGTFLLEELYIKDYGKTWSFAKEVLTNEI